MKSQLILINLCLIFMYGLFPPSAKAGGISVDAGLTPAEDRWILRTQVRYMQRKNDPTNMGRQMSAYALPVVLAYGLRSDLTLMLRQAVMRQEMSMIATTEKSTGLGDLFILAKYRAYRRNTPDYTLGIAPTIGLEFPTGGDSFTSETWDLNTGLYISGRSGPWAIDLNIAYAWNGFADQGENGRDPGDELSLDLALAHQFSIGEKARVALAPVFELNYKQIGVDQQGGQDISNTGNSILYLSPGIKFSTSSTIIEALLQVPAWQDQEGSQLERNIGILIGVRFMF